MATSSYLPDASHFGPGLGTVVHTDAPVKLFVQLYQQKQLQDRQDQQAVASMLQQMRPDKIRPNDMPEYLDKYEKLKSIYFQNKDLYRNPLKNYDDFNKSEQLKSDMLQLASDSRTHATNLQNELSSWNDPKKRAMMSPDSIKTFQDAISMSTNQYKAAHNGQIFDAGHIQYDPEEPDWDKFQKSLDTYASHTGGINDIPVIKDASSNPAIPPGKMSVQWDRVYDPRNVAEHADLMYHSDTDYAKHFDHIFYGQPDQVKALQQKLDATLGPKTFPIQNGQDMAKAFSVTTFGHVQGQPKLQDDPAELKRLNYEDWMNKENIRQQDAYKRIGYRHTLATEQDQQLYKQAGDAVETLGRVGGKDTDTQVRQLLAPFAASSMNLVGKPQILQARGTEDNFVKNFHEQFAPAPNYRMSDDELRQAYRKRTPLLVIPLRYKDPNHPEQGVEHLIINPSNPNARSQMYEALLKIGKGTRKQGVPDTGFMNEEEE